MRERKGESWVGKGPAQVAQEVPGVGDLPQEHQDLTFSPDGFVGVPGCGEREGRGQGWHSQGPSQPKFQLSSPPQGSNIIPSFGYGALLKGQLRNQFLPHGFCPSGALKGALVSPLELGLVPLWELVTPSPEALGQRHQCCPGESPECSPELPNTIKSVPPEGKSTGRFINLHQKDQRERLKMCGHKAGEWNQRFRETEKERIRKSEN